MIYRDCQCRECDGEFLSKRSNQKYCSEACQSRERYLKDVESGRRAIVVAAHAAKPRKRTARFPIWPGLAR